MRKNSIIYLTMLLPLIASCSINGPERPVSGEEIVFTEMMPDVNVITRATEVTTSSLSSIYVGAVSGSAGSESSIWNSTAFTKNGSGVFTGGKLWNDTNPGYKFYASNRPLTFAAAGTTVSASTDYDVVVAYNTSPTFRDRNTLSFQHIFGRIGSVTVSAAGGYTVSGVSILISPKTGGTYNLRTGAWSSTVTGSATAIANATPGTKSNDLYLVPGTYTLTMGWTASIGGSSQTYSGVTQTVTVEKGKVNNFSVTFANDNVLFDVTLASWVTDSTPVNRTFPATELYSFGGLNIAPAPLYYDGTDYVIKDDDWNHTSYGYKAGKTAGSYYHSWIELGKYFDDEGESFSATSGSIDNGGRKVSYGGYSDWRMPTLADWNKLLTTSSGVRSGSTVNGSANKHYALVRLSGVAHGDFSDANDLQLSGLLLFPDGQTITTTGGGSLRGAGQHHAHDGHHGGGPVRPDQSGLRVPSRGGSLQC